ENAQPRDAQAAGLALAQDPHLGARAGDARVGERAEQLHPRDPRRAIARLDDAHDRPPLPGDVHDVVAERGHGDGLPVETPELERQGDEERDHASRPVSDAKYSFSWRSSSTSRA